MSRRSRLGIFVAEVVSSETVKRNLDHPAHMTYVDSECGGSYVRNESVVELVGTMTINERQVGTFRSSQQVLVRLAENGFWYDCATGEQYHSGATLIEAVPAPAGTSEDDARIQP